MTDSSTGSRGPGKRWLFVAVVALLIAIAGYWTFSAERFDVRVVAVARGTVESTVTNSKAGTLRSRLRSRMSAETGGRVTHIYHREGDTVESGALLVKLNDTSHRARLELSQAVVVTSAARHREACLNRDHAKRDLDRARELRRNQVTSVGDLERFELAYRAAEASCSAAEADIARAQAEVRAAHAELEKTEIRAPFDGIVAEVNSEVGEWVTPSPPLLSSPSVIDLIDPASLYVSAPMDEVDSNRIRVGQPTRITVDSHPGESFPGSVVRVAPYVLDIEAQNRTIEVEVEFDAAPEPASMMVGTSADIEVTLATRDDVMRIPTATLLQGGRVLVLVDGVLEERSVKVGLRNWDFVEVTGGLSPEELVVESLDEKEIVAGARARAVRDDDDTAANAVGASR
ncbi:MAG: efflux RND transporter periplasmic adaptor subunit [Myxococcota bacterium]|nr:efflux RND transporter periplasmic adaptor subunit [Myxococcota bacterium]